MNIKNNIIKLSESCLPGKLCVSIPDSSDIIIGQSVYLTVTLVANQNVIEDIKDISIKSDPTVVEVIRHVKWTPTKNKTGGSAIFLLNVNGNILPGKLINYNVHAISNSGLDIQEVTPLNITYTAKQFSFDKTISLDYGKKNYMVTPISDNNIDDPNSEYALISSTITGDDGNPLKNVAVTISSSQPKKLNLVVFATDDKSPQPIEVQSYHEIDVITVYSDSEGKVRFRIYPIKYTQVRLNLTTAILNVTGFTQAYTLYVINSPHNSPFELGSPTIQEMEENNIIKQDSTSSKYFHVQIPSYQPIYATDGILFFIRSSLHDKPKLLEPIYKVNNVNELPSKAFSLSYSDLPINERVEFYYLISSVEGEVRKSYPITVKYVGNDSSNDEVYDKVKIYTSYATLPIDVYSEKNETFEWHGIILSMINRNRKPGQSAKGVTGLYVVIMGTNDQNNKNLPQLGSTGYLNIYVKTPTSRNTHKNYQFSLPSSVDSGKQTGHVVVNIPYCDINRAGPSFSKGLGTLSFDYYIENSDGSKTYSKKWTAKINTVLPNQPHDDNDGCDPL
ncbi:hypothetical protein [Xenorhabdus anantnagensis]|uniref:Inverse autotransporter beta-barrel domain-containing protein n=1 Tax=Xenorhabdus anantnagensis TaxID=3025875 RepID=A0ABT5LPM6_9GAMM|nr:hypothetical protein [Xenorhabdus anantnagensis]MDC9595701.1 hypothetical protein [Xenorhabdus anantnagensis]